MDDLPDDEVRQIIESGMVVRGARLSLNSLGHQADAASLRTLIREKKQKNGFQQKKVTDFHTEDAELPN